LPTPPFWLAIATIFIQGCAFSTVRHPANDVASRHKRKLKFFEFQIWNFSSTV
jgi:hypothetical protein